MVHSDNDAQAKADRYAGGIDGTVLRCLFRKSSQEKWQIASTDVKTAFLLAPKRETKMMVVIPPKVAVEAGVVDPDERWIVERALYGLPSSRADWVAFRDSRLKLMEWEN